MKDYLPDPAFFIPPMLLTVLAFVVGICESWNDHSACHEPWHRIEYVMPAFRLGCWLGGVPGR